MATTMIFLVLFSLSTSDRDRVQWPKKSNL